MANKARGEVEFVVGGETYTARPTFQAVAQLEDTIGGVMPFIRRLQAGDFKTTEIVVAVSIALASGKPKKMAELQPAIFEDGPIKFIGPLAEYLSGIITRGEEEGADAGNATATNGETAES